jgi:hypothetical protein
VRSPTVAADATDVTDATDATDVTAPVGCSTTTPVIADVARRSAVATSEARW